MIAYITALILLAITLLAVVLQKTYYFFPARELKRQARSGDHVAGVLYRAVAYGASLRLLLWLVIGLTIATAFSLLASFAPTWLVFCAVAGLIWYGFAWSPNAQVTSLAARIVVLVTPLVAWTLYYTHPVLDKVAQFISRHRPVTFHTGLFERADLLELIDNQRQLTDSRISHAELDIVQHALNFGTKTVGAVMVPRYNVKTVSDQDVIGPILMDELYESQHSRFPVLARAIHFNPRDDLANPKDAPENIIGTLFLRDLISTKHGGTVRSVMKPTVNYLHEDQSLYQALHAFLTTKHHLFVVINSQQVYVGILTIEDVLEQIIGHKIEDNFDSYDDKQAVAAVTAKSKPKA